MTSVPEPVPDPGGGARLPFGQFAPRVLRAIGVEPDEEVFPHSGLFDDLGLDSLQALQLLFAVEAVAGCDEPPPALPAIFTLADAYDYYLGLLAPPTDSRGATGSGGAP